jgi:outer membrane biosynthesis protein TonB
MDTMQQRPLRGYNSKRFFGLLLVAMLGACLGLGLWFGTIKPLPDTLTDRARTAIDARFVLEQPRPRPQPPAPAQPAPQPLEQKSEPVDLTQKPKLDTPQEDVRTNQTKQDKVRRVYGVRKVYSQGLGSSGRMGDAVIGKLGNTLATAVDTFTATNEELAGEVVSVTTLTQSPRIKVRPRPQYSAEMLEQNIEGTVRVRILVDADGVVKKAIPLNDLGFGSAALAAQASLEALFEPALRGAEAVAVWIILSITFKKLG